MGRRGPGALPQVEKREQYARLIAQGYNNSGGVPDRRDQPADRETVATRPHDHRPGTAGSCIMLLWSPRGAAVRREISDRYLSEQERVRIADLRAGGGRGAGDRGADGPQSVDDQPGAAP